MKSFSLKTPVRVVILRRKRPQNTTAMFKNTPKPYDPNSVENTMSKKVLTAVPTFDESVPSGADVVANPPEGGDGVLPYRSGRGVLEKGNSISRKASPRSVRACSMSASRKRNLFQTSLNRENPYVEGKHLRRERSAASAMAGRCFARGGQHRLSVAQHNGIASPVQGCFRLFGHLTSLRMVSLSSHKLTKWQSSDRRRASVT